MFFIALLTLVDYTKLARSSFDAHRFHHTLTGFRPIPRFYINMLTPQTLRAVVSVAVSLYFRLTVLAHKIFLHSLKTHGEFVT